MHNLSESEYELLRLNNVSQLLEELDNQELDRFDMDDEESQHIAHNIGYLEETRSGRKRNRPALMVEYI